MTKPFLPSDRRPAELLKHWRRAATITALANLRKVTRGDAARGAWADEPGAAEMAAKSAVVPLTSGSVSGNALLGEPVAAFLQSLAPSSAAARLFAACARLSLHGSSIVAMPRFASEFPDAVFVGEGQPIPAMRSAFATESLGPQRKLAAIVGLTNELTQYSVETVETILDTAMREAAGRALDSAVFSTAAATEIAPAGLLHGVTPIAATFDASGGGLGDAMIADLSNLAAAISDAGGGTGILYFANPRQATAVELRASAFAAKVVPTPRLAGGTVVAIETGGVASAFDGLPDVQATREAVVHFEDEAPAQITVAGTPNAVAAPAISLFQADSLALRLVLRCAWATRMPGAVQMVTGTVW